MMRAAMLTGAMMVAGCAPKPAPQPAGAPATAPTAQPAGGGCDAVVVRDLVSHPADDVQADALRRSGARSVRRYRSGDMLTMDFRADRLNIETDGSGRIVALRCG